MIHHGTLGELGRRLAEIWRGMKITELVGKRMQLEMDGVRGEGSA